jgi:hypothetical protein
VPGQRVGVRQRARTAGEQVHYAVSPPGDGNEYAREWPFDMDGEDHTTEAPHRRYAGRPSPGRRQSTGCSSSTSTRRASTRLQAKGVTWNCTSCTRAPVATAAVGLLVERGASSGALAPIFAQLRDDLHVNHPLSPRFNPSQFLPADRVLPIRRIAHDPPCTEGVHWIVLKDPVTISGEELAQFHEAHLLQRAAGAAVLSLEAYRPFPACTDCAPCDVATAPA